MKTKEILGYVLAAIIFIGYIYIIKYLMLHDIPTGNRDLLITLLTTYTVLVVLVGKYFYDGNKETAAKNEMLYRSTPADPPPSLPATEVKPEDNHTP